jgi:hypothetical protein
VERENVFKKFSARNSRLATFRGNSQLWRRHIFGSEKMRAR